MTIIEALLLSLKHLQTNIILALIIIHILINFAYILKIDI